LQASSWHGCLPFVPQAPEWRYAGLRMRQRITRAVRMRLEMNTPFISSWAQALSLQVRPLLHISCRPHDGQRSTGAPRQRRHCCAPASSAGGRDLARTRYGSSHVNLPTLADLRGQAIRPPTSPGTPSAPHWRPCSRRLRCS